jgi:hypothetical protein
MAPICIQQSSGDMCPYPPCDIEAQLPSIIRELAVARRLTNTDCLTGRLNPPAIFS